jgi:hypothetical protein
MHSDSINGFKKPSAQNKVIIKLEAKLSQIKNDFECLKIDHASLVNEHISLQLSHLSLIHLNMTQVGWLSLNVKLVLVYMKRLNL